LGLIDRIRSIGTSIKNIIRPTKEEIEEEEEIKFFRTSLNITFYRPKGGDFARQGSPEPFAEFRVFAYHKKPEEYDLFNFVDIAQHLEVILRKDKLYSDIIDRIDYFQIYRTEQSERSEYQGENTVQFDALNYVHRRAETYPDEDEGYQGEIYEERDITKSELRLIFDNYLEQKLHHVRGELISILEERDYGLKYV
jgi:hypothetical protein